MGTHLSGERVSMGFQVSAGLAVLGSGDTISGAAGSCATGMSFFPQPQRSGNRMAGEEAMMERVTLRMVTVGFLRVGTPGSG